MSSRAVYNKKQTNNFSCCHDFTINFLILKFVACCKYSVAQLVYTSTYNVVFGGQIIRNGDESLPYLPLEKVGQGQRDIIFCQPGFC